MSGTAGVTFWAVAVFLLTVAGIIWYARAKPPRRFRPPDPGRRSKWRTIVEWDTTHTRKTCPACNGAGALLHLNGSRYMIPRHHWENAIWARGNLIACDACWGLGVVARNFIPRTVYPPMPRALQGESP